jgi:hypothetical protein
MYRGLAVQLKIATTRWFLQGNSLRSKEIARLQQYELLRLTSVGFNVDGCQEGKATIADG